MSLMQLLPLTGRAMCHTYTHTYTKYKTSFKPYTSFDVGKMSDSKIQKKSKSENKNFCKKRN